MIVVWIGAESLKFVLMKTFLYGTCAVLNQVLVSICHMRKPITNPIIQFTFVNDQQELL